VGKSKKYVDFVDGYVLKSEMRILESLLNNSRNERAEDESEKRVSK
jgi:hypothetical protein